MNTDFPSKQKVATDQEWEQEVEPEEPWRQWTAEEVAELRQKERWASMWEILGFQTALAFLVAALVFFSAEARFAHSWIFGAVVCLLPNWLQVGWVLGLKRAYSVKVSVAKFMLGQLMKWGVAIVLLANADKWLLDVDWMALLLGGVVTFKLQWLSMLMPYVRMRSFEKP